MVNQFLVPALIFELLGVGIISAFVNGYGSGLGDNDAVTAYCCVYFAAMVITAPISGGHLNPAITLGCWIGGDADKKGSILTVILMWVAQFLGAIFGIMIGRCVRFNYQTDTNLPNHMSTYLPPYEYFAAPFEFSIPAANFKQIDGMSEICFNEMFAGFFMILVFLVVRFRHQDDKRDVVVESGVISIVMYAAINLTKDVSGT